MNKCLVFSHFKGFIFVLKFSFEYNIDFIYHKKKAIELSFFSRFKIFVSMVSTLAFAFKLIGPIIFSAFKKVSFQQSKHFSTFKELFHSQTIVKEFLHKNIFFFIKEVFHKQRLLHIQNIFLQTKIKKVL